jgi:hypothetical protein
MSVRRVALVAVREGTSDAATLELARALERAALERGATRAHVARHLPGSIGGGELTWDALFDSATAASAEPESGALGDAIARIDAVAVDPIATRIARPALAGIKRTLLLRVAPGSDPARVAAFERDMLAMPDYVPAIRNWSFARALGERAYWTHVWEQEFETVAGLSEDYMLSPYHWGLIDGWFDVECPQHVVEPRIAHVYGPARESVLAWTPA